MPQHVGMDWKRHFGGRPKPRHHPAKGNCGHRSAALAHEDISSGFLFSLETAQGAKFDAGQWMDGRHPILKSMEGRDQLAPSATSIIRMLSSHAGMPSKSWWRHDARADCFPPPS